MKLKRWKRLKIAALVIGALLAVALVVNAIMIQVTGSQLAERLESLRQAGQPVAIADLEPPNLPVEDNAATYVRRAQGDVMAMEQELMDILMAPSVTGRLTEEQAQQVADAFDAYPNVLPLLEQASRAKNYRLQTDFTLSATNFINELLPQLQAKRSVFRVLGLRVGQLLTHGQPEESFKICLAMLRLARLADLDPTVINHLVAVAVRGVTIHYANLVLQAADVGEALRQELDTELDRHDTMHFYVHAIRTERAAGLAFFNDSIPWGKSWFTRAYYNRQVLAYLDLMEQEIDTSEASAVPVETPDLMELAKGRVLLEMLVPAIDAARSVERRILAHGRALRVLNAIQLHEVPHEESLDLRALKLPPRATVDPYTGEPLLVEKSLEGWAVYSVGENQTDDGGDFENVKDVGVGPLQPAVADEDEVAAQ